MLYGSIVGNVADTSQAAVPAATVTVINKATNLAREATTRSDGSYSFVNVQPARNEALAAASEDALGDSGTYEVEIHTRDGEITDPQEFLS